LHGAKGFVYENGHRGFWEENEIELFDPNKKYLFTEGHAKHYDR
jgi:hypothetical protein